MVPKTHRQNLRTSDSMQLFIYFNYTKKHLSNMVTDEGQGFCNKLGECQEFDTRHR